jgi:hypothetical protein
MPQTFYIESDEEIISVIGRLRKSGSEKNFFVFPKRALVLQSIINLRLFQREAQKLGKKVVIVTQDEAGRALAEKAGMETEQYSDDFSRDRSHVELAAAPVVPVSVPVAPAAAGPEKIAPRAEMIGSSDFHASIPMPVQETPRTTESVQDASMRLRVRNASPERQPGLNSVRYAEEMSVRSREATEQPPMRSMTDMAPASYQPQPAPAPAPLQAPAPQAALSAALPREERLRNFFADRGPAQTPVAQYRPSRPAAAAPTAVSPHIPSMGRHAGAVFAFLGIAALVSAIGAGIFVFLPKATVHVTPHRTAQSTDIQFSAVADGGMPSESGDTVSARIIEKDIEISRQGETTGASGASSQKARGTVVIYNAYSKEDQPLVATTRLETSDGKVYRLSSGVVVPGMTDIGGKDTPGAIEAEVVADQAGEQYNIGASEFTIPGFKGSPKYAKFSAKSSKAFIGGGDAGDGMKIVSKADLEKAESEAKTDAKARFLEEAATSLAAGEKILEESIDAAVRSVSAPQAGTAASTFEYQGTFHVRAFVVPEEDVRTKVGATAAKEVAGIKFHPISVTLTYGEVSSDYDRRAVRFRAHALITLESDIDSTRFHAAILGKDQPGIEQAMSAFPGIKKISIDFSPEWFVTSVPESEDRVTVVVGPGEE